MWIGVPVNDCTDSIEHRPSTMQTNGPNNAELCCENHEFSDYDVNLKSLIQKMMWSFGLSCVNRQQQCRRKEKHDKQWLVAESGGGEEDPHSVQSSFRFSICSQVEINAMIVNGGHSSATVLMVNLDNGCFTDFKSAELRLRRLQSLQRSISPMPHSLIRFSYSEILFATRNFSKGRFLGRGALSCVFRGRVGLRRTAVAIKRLDKDDNESSKTFFRELIIASSLHDPHIVPLVGFCIDAEGLFLVYKYVSGGSLEQFLHGELKKGVDGGPALCWSARYKVAMGIAEAIEYLHNGTERCVIHRDIKPSNILLSSKKMPKLCDFGLASWTPSPSTPFLCKTVKGTFGYLAPEYFQHGKVYDKTDVYAFGVVLLELVSGRKPFESKRGPRQENLVLWAKPLLEQGCVEKLLDPWLKQSANNSTEVRRMIEAASACIKNEESHRPRMREVIKMLRGEQPLPGVTRKKAILPRNSGRVSFYPQLQLTKTELRSEFATARLGVELDNRLPRLSR